ncbi:tetratricopeptide repeat protein [Microvirga puerhi]|uniref:Tetratricopeptide repeat protein n=1 Tax=Microvirga puerhi TaxID=2876078 RepID=A0ABS7VQU5_9HYPH|nr:tetratricopeptide repeat protein [Microvirga puerhi]MBZ6077430.1 tetratricopeptide repeat protein [Microvirga puerhi]
MYETANNVIPLNTFPHAKQIRASQTLYLFAKSFLALMTRQSHIRFHLQRGRIMYRLGRYDDAISDFRSALRLDWRLEEAITWIDRSGRAKQQQCLVDGKSLAVEGYSARFKECEAPAIPFVTFLF